MAGQRSSLAILFTICLMLCGPLDLFAQTPVVKRKPKTTGKNAAPVSIIGIEDYISKNFVVHTDLSVPDVAKLLERLEKMIDLVSKYYGKPNNQMIEMYVVDDQRNWPPGSIPAEAIESIQNEAGITLSVTATLENGLGEKQITGAKSVVWSVATRGVPQHEAVHAYCHQNFGRTGPTWYAEGMAELGKYWRDKIEGVQIDDEVIEYLKNSDPQDLTEITDPNHRTGDSWRNYAWRWALCHLLSTNPNYSPRFKPLGMALLNGQQTRFDEIYGPMSKEINFEYLQFLKRMDQGYRCDLCAWDWKTKSQRLRGSATALAKVSANRGWQASRVQFKSGDKISYTTTGEWTLRKDGPKIGPEGNDSGQGQLIGIVFEDYELSEPFHLGSSGTYEAVGNGILFVRCRDGWNELADNSGVVTVKFACAK